MGRFFSWEALIPYCWILIIGSWFLYLFLVWKKKSLVWITFLGYAQLVFLGLVLSLIFKNQQNQPTPINGAYLAEVQGFDLEKPNSKENTLKVKRFHRDSEWIETDQLVLIYHQSNLELEPGQLVWVSQAPEPIAPPRNPSEFDYREYLAKRGIFSRQFIPRGKISLVKESSSSTFRFLLTHFREQLGELVKDNIPQKESQPIALALLLGQKNQLDRSLREAFSDAGVMHILAVSGLHVGILVAVLLFLIKPLKLKIAARRFYLVGVVFIIWGYAGITGFSPSVVRASVMFTLVVLGELRERKPPIFNIMAFSALLMIAVNPSVILDIGFQLSYLAVSGIILLQPLILKWWYPPNRFLEYIWQLAAVSIAAQLATFPISVWYFHSFPIWFLPANLIVIPLTFVIMQLGIPFLFLAWMPFVGKIMGWLVGFLIQFELLILSLFQKLPFRFQELSIYPTTMVFVWGMLLIWVSWFYFSKKGLIYFGLFLTLIWAGGRLIQSSGFHSNQAIVYRSADGWAIDFWEDGELKSWNNGIKGEEMKFYVHPNRIQRQWRNQPASLKAMQVQAGELFFPEMGIRIFQDSVFLNQKNNIKWRVWDDPTWKSASESPIFPISQSAVQISF
ncbi:MAG: ComEC family competence protein [Algoriphagus sp.]|uniref:ComEC/Rec2 family competence protein n=1 Tax=Algoriphagus sp. TaxID=1872435 RepID=UPI0017D3CCD3|nr:ComEC/Rec2 family competence protein [Algoriphagus sp.]NVJ86383.1 ComEC family competence protein [Algoriphagus sp.]